MENKKSHRDKLKTLRRFLAGEDVLPHLLETSNALTVTFFETHHGIDTNTILVNGKPCTLQEYDTILSSRQAKGFLIWEETRSYNSQTEGL